MSGPEVGEQVLFGVAAARVEEAERLFRETGNPLWAWEAISICYGTSEHFEQHVRQDLPESIREYLGQVARDLVDIGNLRDPTTRPKKDCFRDMASFNQALFDWKNQARVSLNNNRKAFHADTLAKATGRVVRALKLVSRGRNSIKEYFSALTNINYASLSSLAEERDAARELKSEIARRHGIDEAAAAARIRKGGKLRPDLNPASQDRTDEKR